MLAFGVIGSAIVLFMLAVICVLVGVGIALGLVAAACAGLLVALGMVSSSAMVGLFHRRFSSGFKALHYQICALIGLLAGAGMGWFGLAFWEGQLPGWQAALIGGGAGIIGGFLVAVLVDRVCRGIYLRLIEPRLVSAGLLR